MLERNASVQGPGRSAAEFSFLDLDHALGILRRQWRVLAICVAIGVLLGAIYLALAPRSYYASSEILIQPKLQDEVNDTTQPNDPADLELEVLNQTEVVRSGRIAHAVVAAEHLDTDPAFLARPPAFPLGTLADFVRKLLKQPSPPNPTQLSAEDAAQLVDQGVSVDRVGRSSVLLVGYTASTPALAFRIASAYADAFVRDQLDTDTTKQAADWLQQQLVTLGDDRRAASDAVVQFRRASGNNVSDDQKLTDLRLQALTNQLVTAQSDTAQARAIATQLQAAVAAGPAEAGNFAGLLAAVPSSADPNSSTPDPKTTDMLAQYTAVTERLAEVSAAFGPDHPQVAELQRERVAVTNQIYAQLQQLNQGSQNNLAIAEGRETALHQDVLNEGEQVVDSNQTQVKLDELQQKSTALETLYDTFLSRYDDALQRQSFPIPSVRVITEPVLPLKASSPRTVFVLVGAVLFGLLLGICFAAVNELRERAFRVGSQISRDLSVRFIGYLPELPVRRVAARRHPHDGNREEVQQLVRGDVVTARSRIAVAGFIETLKATKILMQARRPHGRGVVIGVTSVLPGEGKTTYGVALASLLAAGGNGALLIDGDLRHPSASQLSAPGARGGLVDAAAGRPWHELLHVDGHTGLSVLPVSGPFDGAANDPLASAAFDRLLQEARDAFDYIIIDMPPLGPIVDALEILPLTDGFVLVTEWGRTPKRLVQGILEREPQLENSLLGVVLNKVNIERLARYSELGSSERYLGAYARYYEAAGVAEVAGD